LNIQPPITNPVKIRTTSSNFHQIRPEFFDLLFVPISQQDSCKQFFLNPHVILCSKKVHCVPKNTGHTPFLEQSLKNVKTSWLSKLMDRITPSWWHSRDQWFALPVDEEIAQDWKIGDEVKITIERLEDENP
jgi:hypothetical protein